MSLWFRRKNQQGKRYLYTVSGPEGCLIPLIGIIIALILPLLVSCLRSLGH